MGWEKFPSAVSEKEETGGWARNATIDLMKNKRS
jgi:hypothetical protein